MNATINKSKRGRPKAGAAASTSPAAEELPQFFNLKSLAKHLGVPAGVVVKMQIPRVDLGWRTKLYTREAVLKRITELKSAGGAK